MAISAQVANDLRNKDSWLQLEQDCAAMQAFLLNPGDQRVAAFLRKLFLTMRYGGLLFRENGSQDTGLSGWQWWHTTGMPIGSVLGHGGRLMIQYRSSRFKNWLFKEVKSKISKRVSTHEMSGRQGQSDLPGGLVKHITELKCKVNWCGGVHAALWGVGNHNPHSNTVVKRDGKNGHFCIVRDHTHGECEGILVGLEGSGPGKSDQYGGSHGASAKSGEFSPTGSQKWRFLGLGPGCRYADDTYYAAGPKTKVKKRIFGKNKTKETNPAVADTLLIDIPANWQPAHFENEPWDDTDLLKTSRLRRDWTVRFKTPEYDQVKDTYGFIAEYFASR